METPYDSERTKLLLICIDDTDRHGNERLYEAIVRLLYKHGVAGATALPGIMGYGVRRRIHKRGLLGMSDDEPVIIVSLDSEAKLRKALPDIRAMVKEGLVALVDADLIPRVMTESSKD